jgi:hypothetical protein
MKFFPVLLLVLLASCVRRVSESFDVLIKTPVSGVRVYDQEGNYLGLSPVVLHQFYQREILDEALSRYYIRGKEIFLNGIWRVKVYAYQEGVRVPMTASLVFDLKKGKEVNVKP